MKVSDLTIEEFGNIIHKVVEDEIEDLSFMFDPTVKTKIEEELKDIREGRTISIVKLVTRRNTKSGNI